MEEVLLARPRPPCANLLKPWQQLVDVRYFTARISGPADKQKRQNVFLEANEALGKCKTHFGKYQEDLYQCRKCGQATWCRTRR